MTEQTKDKYLINCQDGTNNLERATIPFILGVSASKTGEAAMFATADAVPLFVKGAADGLVADGHEPLSDLMAQFLGNGGKVWLCPVCVRARGIRESELVDGVEVAGAPRTMAFLQSGAKLLARLVEREAIAEDSDGHE